MVMHFSKNSYFETKREQNPHFAHESPSFSGMPLLRTEEAAVRVEEDLQAAAKKSGETFFAFASKKLAATGEYYQTKKEDGHYHTNGDYYYGSLKTGAHS